VTREPVRRFRLDVEGVGTQVLEAGPESDSEAALFVHGNPGSRLDWEDLVTRTGAEGIRAIAFDLPGFGESDKPADFPATVPDYAAYIERARPLLGLDRVHLVVHDFGGPIGLTWAGTHAEAVASLTIVNAPPVSGYRWYLLAHVWRTPVAGELLHRTLTRRTFMTVTRRGNPRGLPQAFLDRMWRDYDAGTRRTVIKLYRATDARRASPIPPERFRELDWPVLVVWGMHDVYIPFRFAELHRQAFPAATYVQLADSGHFPMADDPEGLAAAVVPFLRRMHARSTTTGPDTQ